MENFMSKVCSKCLITKDISNFYIQNNKPIAACKECTKKASRNYAIRAGKIKGNYGKSRFEKLLGQKINDWTVIGTELIKGKRAKVLCKCKCGIEQLVICDRLEKNTARGCRKCYPVNGSNSHLFQGVGEISVSYLRKIKENAVARNIPIDVTAECLWDLYLKQNKKCALTGMDIDFGKHIHRGKTKLQSQTASLDRIDSKHGYVIGNLQWVHKHVNIMKNKYDNDYFKHICKLVIENAN
jgi:hypothetical protein